VASQAILCFAKGIGLYLPQQEPKEPQEPGPPQDAGAPQEPSLPHNEALFLPPDITEAKSDTADRSNSPLPHRGHCGFSDEWCTRISSFAPHDAH
jgi:hypothetical protein